MGTNASLPEEKKRIDLIDECDYCLPARREKDRFY
jgi:hypothetical protein